MCLTRVHKKIPEQYQNLTKAYSVKIKCGNSYYPLHSLALSSGYKLNKKYEAEECSGGRYEMGFHIIPDLESAREYRSMFSPAFFDMVILECKIKKPFCYGEQDGLPVLLTKEIVFLKEVK